MPHAECSHWEFDQKEEEEKKQHRVLGINRVVSSALATVPWPYYGDG